MLKFLISFSDVDVMSIGPVRILYSDLPMISVLPKVEIFGEGNFRVTCTPTTSLIKSRRVSVTADR